MRKVTLVRGARQLLTLHGPNGPRRGTDLNNLGIIEDGAVLIADGLIREIGPTRRVENLALAREAEEIDASGRVVMPGFVDSHTRLVSGPLRISQQTSPVQELSARILETVAVRALEQAVRHGTTTVEAKSGLGAAESRELKILRIHSKIQRRAPLVSTFLVNSTVPDAEDRDVYLERVCEYVLPLIKRRKLAQFVDIRCEPGAFTPVQSKSFLASARALGFGLKLQSGVQPSSSSISVAVELAATSVDGVIEPKEQDISALAQSRVVATLLPGSVFFAGTHRYAPARALIEKGAAVALATSYNPETIPSQNMQMTIALACMRMGMTPAEAISAATINGAHAVRRASTTGSLEIGKSADLLILGVPDYQEVPYHFGVNVVELVMQAGVVLVERSEVKWPVH